MALLILCRILSLSDQSAGDRGGGVVPAQINGIGGLEGCSGAVEDAKLTVVGGTAVAGAAAWPCRGTRSLVRTTRMSTPATMSPPAQRVHCCHAAEPGSREEQEEELAGGHVDVVSVTAMSVKPSSHRPSAEQRVEWTSIASNGDGGGGGSPHR
jgi:hypothetical protein